jgi:formyl-CoA transferase/CoA:oxalate CoA-transferase
VDALEGVRVVDFARHMAAPFATQILSDFGAEVVKVESLPDGDPSRRSGTDFVGGDSAVFLNWNHGKRSIALDLRTDAGLDVARRLVARADVVVENYRPGVADAIGIGYDAVAPTNERLVYCSLSAFGHEGPWAGQPGTDPVVQAMSGVMHVTGEADAAPVRVGVPMADFTGSMALAQGVLLGLAARERTGRGQRIDVSMLHAMVLSLSTRVASYWATGEEPGRWGSAHSVVAPYQAFETADGYVVAGAWAQESWPRFCSALGRPDLEDDPRFRTNADRVANREAIVAEVQRSMRERTSAEWERQFFAARALFAPVLPISEVLAHPQLEALPAVEHVEHPRHGRLPMPSTPIRMSDTPGRVRRPPPGLGEHTVEVLAELGFAAADVEELLRSGAARQDEAVAG